MPLEQIRPSLHVYASKRERDMNSREAARQIEGDGAEEASTADTIYQEPSRRYRSENMDLLKLGGVGGVTRSGSWNHNRLVQEKKADADFTQSPEFVSEKETDQLEGLVRARSISGHDTRQRAALDHFRSCSSDVPSSSSRTSTSSYSAAAFSLRSVSNRNSVSSASSSVASSRSHTAASEDESTATNSSNRVSQVIPSPASSDTTGPVALEEHSEAMPARGVWQNYHFSLGGVESGTEAGRAAPAPGGTSTSSATEGRQGRNPPLVVRDAADKTESTSPKNSAPNASLEAPVAPFRSLTLSAAAASPDLSAQPATESNFVPPVPRRHTGAFVLRSLSQLSQTGAAYGTFLGEGGGRAAARENARHSTSYTENAPFSELEARHALHQTSSHKGRFHSTSPPTSPRTMRARLESLVHTDAEAVSATSPDDINRAAWGPVSLIHSLADSAPPWSNLRDVGLSRQGALLKRTSQPDVATENSPTPSEGQETDHLSNQNFSTDSALSVRPSMSHSLSTTNVLRTPTTEEWSRFLTRQGLDPSHVAVRSAGRSRTNTGRSSTSQRRSIADRMAITAGGASTALPLASDFLQQVKKTVPAEFDMDREGDDEAEVKDDFARLTASLATGRPASLAKASLPGSEDLSMLHEEDEEGDEHDSEGDEISSSDERMQALHEAISRPPSRRATPTVLDSSSSPVRPDAGGQWTVRLNRGSDAALIGYPLPPTGEKRRIEDFVILSDIGRGAYGHVKKAQLRDAITGHGMGSAVCIKYIIKSRILADCWRRHKMLGPIPIEIHVMDQLRRLPYKPTFQHPAWSAEELLGAPAFPDTNGHPSLCKMLEFFEDHEYYYMVMPCFGKGQDLFDYVESQPHGLSSLDVRCIFGQVADGLRFLHRNNIVHRDIKDENVILDGSGHAQIIDFGSAAHVNRNGRLFDTFSGTLDYAAAEILRGEKYGGREQDVWALGVVGYVLLCGDCPFWNGEEAIVGLQATTRAFEVLQDRCSTLQSSNGGSQIASGDMEELRKRQQDQIGQSDGGGRIMDAADLIQRCLEVDLTRRPSMDAVCQHRFLIGQGGWYGPLGWLGETVATSPGSVQP